MVHRRYICTGGTGGPSGPILSCARDVMSVIIAPTLSHLGRLCYPAGVKSHPPSGPGLPPSGHSDPHAARTRLQRRHPVKKGALTVVDTAQLLAAATKAADTPPERMTEVTRTIGATVQRTPELVRDAIRKARASLAARADEYVDLHFMAAAAAADKGDAGPAQWALEHIGEGKERVVDIPAKGVPIGPGDTRPQIQIGIVLGGMPKPQPQLADANIVPSVEAELLP